MQPSPIVHFYWLVNKIIPQTDIVINPELQAQLEILVNQTQWVAYNPDREEIWNNTKSMCYALANQQR